MARNIIFALGVYILFTASAVLANQCEDLFDQDHRNSNQQIQFLEQISKQDVIHQMTNTVSSITSKDSFLQFLNSYKLFQDNTAAKTVELIWNELGPEGAQKVATQLLFNHKHVAVKSLNEAMITVARGEAHRAEDVMAWLKKPLNAAQFKKWHRLGESIESNSKFRSDLETAISDIKDFDGLSGKYLNIELAVNEFISIMKDLNNPTLVGAFIEYFQKADRLTKQYILDQLTEPLRIDQQNAFLAIKGFYENSKAQYKDPYFADKRIESVLSVPLTKMQELAFFDYRSNGYNKRPRLTDWELTKSIALRVLRRLNYRFLEGSSSFYEDTNVVRDSQYISEVLLNFPAKDADIDRALSLILESGEKMTASERQIFTVRFAFLEVRMAERNAKGLSQTAIDFKYLSQILSNQTHYDGLLGLILDFHKKYNLDVDPTLKVMVVNYFSKFSTDFNHPEMEANLNLLKSDFGIK